MHCSPFKNNVQPIVHQAYIKEGYKNLSEETKRKK